MSLSMGMERGGEVRFTQIGWLLHVGCKLVHVLIWRNKAEAIPVLLPAYLKRWLQPLLIPSPHLTPFLSSRIIPLQLALLFPTLQLAVLSPLRMLLAWLCFLRD